MLIWELGMISFGNLACFCLGTWRVRKHRKSYRQNTAKVTVKSAAFSTFFAVFLFCIEFIVYLRRELTECITKVL